MCFSVHPTEIIGPVDFISEIPQDWQAVGIQDSLFVEVREVGIRPDSSSWLISQVQGACPIRVGTWAYPLYHPVLLNLLPDPPPLGRLGSVGY